MRVLPSSMIRWILLTCVLILSATNLYLYTEKQAIEDHITDISRIVSQNKLRIKNAMHPAKAQKQLKERLTQPTDRLSLGHDLQKLSQDLNLQQIEFKVSPELPLTEESNSNLKTSKVNIHFQHKDDSSLYLMISKIIHDFPGLVIPLELTLSRDPQSITPLIKGSFQYEWIKESSRGDNP